MRKIATAVAFIIALGGTTFTASAATPTRADLEQKLASLKAQLADLEIEAGMVPFSGTPTGTDANLLGGDSFLNPAQGNQPDTLSVDGNGVTHVVPMNEKYGWVLGDSGTNAQTNNLTVGGGITQTNPSAINTILGLQIVGNQILGGTCSPTIYTTSTTLTPFGFLGVCTFAIMNSTSGVTSTLNLPTGAAVAAVQTFVPGGIEMQWVYNSSTANLVVNASSGLVFKNATTTAWPAGYSSSTVIIPAGGVMSEFGQGLTTSSLLIYNTLYQ